MKHLCCTSPSWTCNPDASHNGEIVQDPPHDEVVHHSSCHFITQQWWHHGVENSEVGEHDPHSASCLLQLREGSVQQIDDCIIHPSVWLVGEMKQVNYWSSRGLRWAWISLFRVFIKCDVNATGLQLLEPLGYAVSRASSTGPGFSLGSGRKMGCTATHSWSAHALSTV